MQPNNVRRWILSRLNNCSVSDESPSKISDEISREKSDESDSEDEFTTQKLTDFSIIDTLPSGIKSFSNFPFKYGEFFTKNKLLLPDICYY